MHVFGLSGVVGDLAHVHSTQGMTGAAGRPKSTFRHLHRMLPDRRWRRRGGRATTMRRIFGLGHCAHDFWVGTLAGCDER